MSCSAGNLYRMFTRRIPSSEIPRRVRRYVKMSGLIITAVRTSNPTYVESLFS
jgi:hypothetical protein